MYRCYKPINFTSKQNSIRSCSTSKTQDFQVTSTRVDLGKPKRGNMCKVLKTCATTLSFAKSLTPFSGGGIAGIGVWAYRRISRRESDSS